MKKLIIAGVAFVIVIASSIYIEKMLTSLSGDMLISIHNITKDIETENWDNVDVSLDGLEKQWEEISDMSGIIIDHSLLEKATISLKKARVYCTFREKEEALAEFKEFEFTIDHLPKGQYLQMKNIF